MLAQVTEMCVHVKIMCDDEYEKTEEFSIELGTPVWHGVHGERVDTAAGQAQQEGGPILADISTCKVPS